MRVWLRTVWESLRSSFWFVPVMMVTIASVAALLSVDFDASQAGAWLHERGWIYAGDPRGAITVLGTIAGSMVTIAGVVFSMTLVALSLASSQFGPRLLRNFMRDTINQVVLGIFIATFLYCLLVLRSVRHGPTGAFVPHLSVTLGVLLAVASLFVLIYFIHHVSVSIQADELVAGVGGDFDAAIDRLFPTRLGEAAADAPSQGEAQLPDGFDREARRLAAPRDGYLQLVEADALLALSCENDLLLRLEHRPGDYVVQGNPLVAAWPADRVGDHLERQIVSQFVLSIRRTPVQDVQHAVNQLVEIALRALSPGVNDPFTAVVCIDRLGSSLCRLGGREMPSPMRHDEDGALRVIARPVTFAEVADAAFSPIRHAAASNPQVLMRLLDTIAEIADHLRRSADVLTLRAHAQWIAQCEDGMQEVDRHEIAARHRKAIHDLEAALQRIGEGAAG